MRKALKDKRKDYWECDRCEINSLKKDSMCPCPRGSCDAELVGVVVTKREIIYNITEWKYQYIISENIHYLTEHHPEDGIISELFFKTWDEYDDYIKENEITIT